MKEHVLKIGVEDGGAPPKLANATLRIVVLADNSSLALTSEDAKDQVHSSISIQLILPVNSNTVQVKLKYFVMILCSLFLS